MKILVRNGMCILSIDIYLSGLLAWQIEADEYECDCQ